MRRRISVDKLGGSLLQLFLILALFHLVSSCKTRTFQDVARPSQLRAEKGQNQILSIKWNPTRDVFEVFGCANPGKPECSERVWSLSLESFSIKARSVVQEIVENQIRNVGFQPSPRHRVAANRSDLEKMLKGVEMAKSKSTSTARQEALASKQLKAEAIITEGKQLENYSNAVLRLVQQRLMSPDVWVALTVDPETNEKVITESQEEEVRKALDILSLSELRTVNFEEIAEIFFTRLIDDLMLRRAQDSINTNVREQAFKKYAVWVEQSTQCQCEAATKLV
jgi:hypothetical protein